MGTERWSRKDRNETYRGWTEDMVRDAGEGVGSTGSDALDKTFARQAEERKRLTVSYGQTGGDARSAEAKEGARDALLLLPPEFVRGYEDLFHRAWRLGTAGRGKGDDRKGELGRATGKPRPGGGGRGGARRQKKAGGNTWEMASEKALAEKARVDRQLRKLARSMRDDAGADVGRETVLKCGEAVGKRGCGRWVEARTGVSGGGWKYCPNCGLGQVEGLRSAR